MTILSLMVAIKGSKQKQQFTSAQINEIKEYKIYTEDSLKEFLIKYSISFDAFKRRATVSGLKIPFGYSYTEYLANPKLQSPYNKNNIKIDCTCGKVYIAVLFGFHKRKYKEPLCDICYKQKYAYDAEWKQNNSKAQLIAQNRQEVIEKQMKSQKKRFQNEKLIQQYRETGKKLWENPEYRKKVISNSSISKHGTYKNIIYQSSIELAFIVWCENNNKKIKNYDGVGIPYIWNQKEHRYYPDFIVDENLLVEVKGRGMIYERNYNQNQNKFEALKNWCKINGLSARIVFDSDLGKKAIKEARKLHGTLNSQNNNTI